MVTNCANPSCGKPLHYLREGRVSTFGASSLNHPAGKPWHGLKHYWLCGSCSQTMTLVQDTEGVRAVPMPPVRAFTHYRAARQASAS